MKQPAKTNNDANKAIQDMMDTIDHLRDIYISENHALETADTHAFMDLQQKKLEAANQYQNKIESILARGEEMKAVNPLLKNRLVEMQKNFSHLAKKNVEALQRMHRCTERLGELIVSAAKDAAKTQRTSVYGETGALQRNCESRSVSMGISETA